MNQPMNTYLAVFTAFLCVSIIQCGILNLEAHKNDTQGTPELSNNSISNLKENRLDGQLLKHLQKRSTQLSSSPSE